MTDALFESRTPRLALPLLFAGQAQKEGFVNELAARVDALLFLAVEGEASSPPPAPLDGQAWLVGPDPAAEWAGRAGQIAARQAGNWLFAAPVAGMRLFNKATGQDLRFASAWAGPTRPAVPTGGTTVDSEARAAISAVIAALTEAGIVPQV